MPEPLLAEWTDEGAFKPLQRHAKHCDATFVVGQRYFVTAEAPRNMAAHRAYFAEIRKIWMNLPEQLATEHPDPEKLRKWALCKTGFCTESRQVFTTARDAILAAAFAAAASDFSIVAVEGNCVMIWRPESQSVEAMGGDRFRESKNAVLNFLSPLIGVEPRQIEQAAARDAA